MRQAQNRGIATLHTSQPLVTQRRSHRWYFATVGVAALAIAVAGFAPSLLFPSRRLGSVNLLVAVHGILFAAWLVLFVVQSLLIARGQTATHRRLGVAAIGLAIAMLVTGYSAVIEQTRRGFELSGDLNIKSNPVGEAVFPLGDLLTFAILVTAGLLNRRRPDTHKRLMLLGTLGGLMPATLAHFVGHHFGSAPAVFLPTLVGVFLAPAIYDRVRFGRFVPLTLWGGILLFVWANIRAAVIGPSAAWRQLMEWLCG